MIRTPTAGRESTIALLAQELARRGRAGAVALGLLHRDEDTVQLGPVDLVNRVVGVCRKRRGEGGDGFYG